MSDVCPQVCAVVAGVHFMNDDVCRCWELDPGKRPSAQEVGKQLGIILKRVALQHQHQQQASDVTHGP